jgi:signal transduction histidine kinase
MNNISERQRIEALFSDLEHLDADPASNSPEIKQKIEGLRFRLSELEKQVPVSMGNTFGAQDRLTHAILYEKDQVGYVYSDNKLEPLNGSKRSLMDKKDVLKSSITINGETIGDMQVASPNDRQLTPDEIILANAIAQHASLQIQNLRLLSAAERSRVDAETATRRFIHEGWDSYLDAIQRTERIGYTYDQSSVSAYFDKLHVNGGVQAPLKVMDEQIGLLYIEPDHNRPLTEAEKQMINAVASRAAQQVENIRLLADASRARADAEETVRRLAHDNWQKFATDNEGAGLAFVYDSLQVKPLHDVELPQDIALSQPLVVNGETIGQLSVAGMKNIQASDAGILSSIAAQTSIHLETIRLSEELKQRAIELEELDRLKSAFLANMSHELRTPLNSILGFTDVMLEGLDGALTDYMNNDLRLIQKNGQHLLHLINDVLDMAKIESGRMNLLPETFKVHSLFEEVTSITSTLASEKNIALFIQEDSDQEIEIYADITRIRQVMINLVNNSIKFTDKGKISICAKPMDGGRVMITVKDTGIGIPLDKLEAVFQEFTQVDTSSTRKVGGTGLGLPISRRLVEMHGGLLWAESTGVEGEGSTFFVELPVEARITEVIEKQEK